MAKYTKEQIKEAKASKAAAQKHFNLLKRQFESAQRALQRAEDKVNKMTTPQSQEEV